MNTRRFSLNREEYKDTPYHAREATWDQPDTQAEAVSGGHFQNETAVMQSANNQLAVKRGHVFSDTVREIKAKTVKVRLPNGDTQDPGSITDWTGCTRLDKDGKPIEWPSFESLEAEARTISIKEVTPRVPGTGSQAGKSKEKIAAAEAKADAATAQVNKMLAAMSDKAVKTWLDQGIITEPQYLAEMERRASAKK